MSRKNLDKYWDQDTVFIKTLRQYLFGWGILEGNTQWSFQHSHILHKVLDVITLTLLVQQCLDYHTNALEDQSKRMWDSNLKKLKQMAECKQHADHGYCPQCWLSWLQCCLQECVQGQHPHQVEVSIYDKISRPASFWSPVWNFRNVFLFNSNFAFIS